MKKFIAKSDGTTLEQHTRDVITCLKSFFNMYPDKTNEVEKELLYRACLYHDCGKVNSIFQEYIQSENKKIPDKWLPHGFFSVFCLDEELKTKYDLETYKALVTAIYYHHAREDNYKSKTLYDDFKKYVKENAEIFLNRTIKKSFNVDTLLLFRYPNNNKSLNIKQETWILYSKIKGILNRCDYAASAGEKTMDECIPKGEKRLSEIILEHFSNLITLGFNSPRLCLEAN